MATVTSSGALFFWITISVPIGWGLEIDQEQGVQIAPAGSATSIVGMLIFPDGQIVIVTIGQSGGLYVYSSETLSSNVPSAPIPGTASVPAQGPVTMAVGYATDASGQPVAANIYVLAPVAPQSGNPVSTRLQLFAATYQFGTHTPIQSWQWGASLLPTGRATVDGKQVPWMPGVSAIAVAPNGDVGIFTSLSAEGAVLPTLTYWAIPQGGVIPQSIKPTYQQTPPLDVLEVASIRGSIAFDGNGSAHIALTGVSPVPKLGGNNAYISDLVIDPSGAGGINQFGTVEVLGSVASAGSATMASGPNGEVDCYYQNAAALGSSLICYSLPAGATAWSVPTLVT